MLAEAMAKLQAEIDGSNNNPYVQYIGQYLLTHLKSNPHDAERIMDADKTLAKSLVHTKNIAEKKKVGNVAMLTDEEVHLCILQYFGIVSTAAPYQAAPMPVNTVSSAGFSVNLDDYL